VPGGAPEADEQRGEAEDRARTRGPSQWVPSGGALSRFMLRGAAVAFVAQLFALVSGFTSQVLLARLLSPEGLGIYFLTQSVVIMTANVGELGMPRPIARMISTDVGSGRAGAALRALAAVAVIGGGWGLLVVAAFASGLGDWIAVRIFDSSVMAASVVVVALWIASKIILDLAAAVLQGLHRVGVSSVFASAIVPTTIAVSCAVMLWAGVEIRYQHAIWIASAATIVAGAIAVVLVWTPFSGVVADGPPRMRALLSSTLPIFGAGMLQVAAVQADLWIVGAQLSPSEVALYGAAKRLTVLVGFPVAILGFVVPPLIADLFARGERERLQRLVRAATTAASAPAFAAFLLFVLFGEQVLAIAYGDVYAEGSTVLRILIADKLFFLTLGPASLTLVMTGHERVVFRITMVSATTSLLAMYLGGRHFGPNGVAVAYAVTNSATGLWYLFEARRQTKIWVHLNPLAIRPIMEVVQRAVRRLG
jgi:O-antigen/teichoic acid export membrane protein